MKIRRRPAPALAALTLYAAIQIGCQQTCADSGGVDGACATQGGFATESSSSSTEPSTSAAAASSSEAETGVTTETDSETDAPPPSCGDGRQDPGEECDDGAEGNHDNAACTPQCMLNVCGDAKILEGVEECDNGPVNTHDNAPCTASCLVNVCGDGKRLTGIEQCDDGAENNHDNAACTAECLLNVCGDGKLFSDLEACDASPEEGCEGCELLPLTGFVTSAEFKGQIPLLFGQKSLELADAHCQKLAAAAGLPATSSPKKYKAWLANGAEGPATRLAPQEPSRAIQLPNGEALALSWHSLLESGALLRPFDVDEFGQSVGSSAVWTNTLPNGEPAGPNTHCEDWTTASGLANGSIGLTTETGANWTHFQPNSCANSARLYCLQVAF